MQVTPTSGCPTRTRTPAPGPLRHRHSLRPEWGDGQLHGRGDGHQPGTTTTSLTPTSTPVGSSPTITVSGWGFVPGSTVEWDGSPLSTTYITPPTTVSIAPRTLTAQLPATDTAGATVGTVTVVNLAPGGGTSNPQFLYVVPPPAAIAAANVATSTSATGSATASVGGGTAGSLSAPAA